MVVSQNQKKEGYSYIQMANKQREANANLMGWMISSNFSESPPNVFTGAKGVLRCFSAASMSTARHSLK